jgi:hypothetical protein
MLLYFILFYFVLFYLVQQVYDKFMPLLSPCFVFPFLLPSFFHTALALFPRNGTTNHHQDSTAASAVVLECEERGRLIGLDSFTAVLHMLLKDKEYR